MDSYFSSLPDSRRRSEARAFLLLRALHKFPKLQAPERDREACRLQENEDPFLRD